MTWMPWIAHVSSKALAACDYVGETLADFLGITAPKYQYEIDEAKRMQEEEKAEKKAADLEMAGWNQSQPADPTVSQSPQTSTPVSILTNVVSGQSNGPRVNWYSVLAQPCYQQMALFVPSDSLHFSRGGLFLFRIIYFLMKSSAFALVKICTICLPRFPVFQIWKICWRNAALSIFVFHYRVGGFVCCVTAIHTVDFFFLFFPCQIQTDGEAKVKKASLMILRRPGNL